MSARVCKAKNEMGAALTTSTPLHNDELLYRKQAARVPLGTLRQNMHNEERSQITVSLAATSQMGMQRGRALIGLKHTNVMLHGWHWARFSLPPARTSINYIIKHVVRLCLDRGRRGPPLAMRRSETNTMIQTARAVSSTLQYLDQDSPYLPSGCFNRLPGEAHIVTLTRACEPLEHGLSTTNVHQRPSG